MRRVLVAATLAVVLAGCGGGGLNDADANRCARIQARVQRFFDEQSGRVQGPAVWPPPPNTTDDVRWFEKTCSGDTYPVYT